MLEVRKHDGARYARGEGVQNEQRAEQRVMRVRVELALDRQPGIIVGRDPKASIRCERSQSIYNPLHGENGQRRPYRPGTAGHSPQNVAYVHVRATHLAAQVLT
jgi:hypothetical protein